MLKAWKSSVQVGPAAYKTGVWYGEVAESGLWRRVANAQSRQGPQVQILSSPLWAWGVFVGAWPNGKAAPLHGDDWGFDSSRFHGFARWCNGSTGVSETSDPGSSPGWAIK
jgi:hypothetical protein